jgi:hypothetical protein
MIFGYLFILLLFILVSSEYGWKGSIIFTIIIGFIQDPLRKMVALDSSYYSQSILAFFLATVFLLRSKRKNWDFKYMCWTNPKLLTATTLFLYFLGFQAFNSYARFGDGRLTLIGIFFYLVPLLALWVGFQVGVETKFLRRILTIYTLGSAVIAVTVFMSVIGVDSPLFEEVGAGLDITLFGKGNSGFWRTSEIAAWHLAAGSCIAIILGVSSRTSLEQALWFLLSVGMALLATTTGRRKAIGIIVAFVSLYMLYYVLNSNQVKVMKALGSLCLVTLFVFGSFGTVFQQTPSNSEDVDFSRYSERASTFTLDEVNKRLQVQGISAFLRGIEISGPFGYGLGAGANSGNTGVGENRATIRSLSYVTEGGGGRIIAEIGIIGAILVLNILLNVLILSFTNIKLGRIWVKQETFVVFLGLLIFIIVNIATFFAAGQVYSDIFILFILGLSFGAFTALPVTVANDQALGHSD